MLNYNIMPISGKKIIKLLKKRGWDEISQSGSHKGKKITIIPLHGNKDLSKGTIKGVEKQTGKKIL